MKRNKLMILFPALLLISSLTGCGTSSKSNQLTIWVDAKATSLTREQINTFKANNPDFKYDVRVESVSEQESATNMITDVEAGADLFVYAQDQFSRLITAGALSAVPSSKKDDNQNVNNEEDWEEEVKNSHLEAAIKAVTHKGEKDTRERIYSYPVTADNGYFLFYNKEKVTEEQAQSVEGILEACANNPVGGQPALFGLCITDGFWYDAGFFLSQKVISENKSTGEIVTTGEPMCVSDWTTSPTGKFISVNDTFKEKGQFACKAMAKIFNSGYHLDSHNASDLDESKRAIALVSGNWDYATAKEKLGDNLGVTKLPTFTVDGETYQMGSFSGYKLMGVKPHTDATKSYWCAALAKYLTGKECQLQRFNNKDLGWGPSNIEATEDPAVKESVALTALREQNKYAVPQGSYPNNWWKFGEQRIPGQIKNTKEYQTTDLSDAQANTLLAEYDTQIRTLIEEE